MILTDKEIREYVQSNVSLIEEFEEASLQSESYDLSLGTTVSRFNSEFQILYLDQQKSIDELYAEELVTDSGFLLGPREYILVSVKEKINLPPNLTAHIRPRTKFTRAGILVSGQHCNSSYSGYLTLGLYNANSFVVCLKPGIKIAQIVFEELCSRPSENKQYNIKEDASFQNETAIKGADFSKEDIGANGCKLRNLKNNPGAQSVYNRLVNGLMGK